MAVSFDREYSREEIEAIYYLIDLFLKNKTYYSYATKDDEERRKTLKKNYVKKLAGQAILILPVSIITIEKIGIAIALSDL